MGRIGIYSGSFDPPCRGHLEAAHHAIGALGLEKMLLVPTELAPHKDLPALAQQYELLHLMAQGEPKIEVSTSSDPCDVLAQLRLQYPQAEPVLLMESEQAATEATAGLMQQGIALHLLQSPMTGIDAAQLKRMMIFGCAEEFLPAGVGEYIRTHRLYGVGRDYQNLPEAELEQVVISLLKPNRVAHVLGCRDAAVALAKHWGADPVAAARAALLHDVTKALDGPLQLTLCHSYGMILDDFSKRYPKTLHALTGALVADRIFGENEVVVSAIRHHTTGKADMRLLEKIIYIADYVEPNRTIPGVDKLRHLAFTDLDAALKEGLLMTVSYLNEQGSEVSPESREALAWLTGKDE